VKGILADINAVGLVQHLVTILEGAEWRDLWAALAAPLSTFKLLGLDSAAPDQLVWHTCQQRELVLVTTNRNHDGPDSLEAVIRAFNTPQSLPVLTIGSAEHLVHSRDYAEAAATRLLDYLLNIDDYRGAGRLYMP
jgi:hypothetical protein